MTKPPAERKWPCWPGYRWPARSGYVWQVLRGRKVCGHAETLRKAWELAPRMIGSEGLTITEVKKEKRREEEDQEAKEGEKA
jgi:hypothetical protein